MLTEKSFDTGELKLNYFETGSGAPMVLLHGLTARWQAWNTIIPELESRWHLYALDLRGHGKSGRGIQYRIVDYARDVVAFLHHLHQPVVLVGHSTGALTAIAAAEHSTGLSAVIPIDPPIYVRSASMPTRPHIQEWFTWVKNTVQDNPPYEVLLARCRVILPPETPEAQVEALADQVSGIAAGTVENVLRDEHLANLDLGHALQSISCPMLLLQGDWTNGGTMRAEDADFVRANCPTAEIVFIPNGSHLFLDQFKDTILQNMNTFLTAL